MSDQEHNEASPEEVKDEAIHRNENEELPLTGEEVTLPGEASATEDIIGGASVTETSQVEPVHMGVTPTSLDDVLASRAQDEQPENSVSEDQPAEESTESSSDEAQGEASAEEPVHEASPAEEPAEAEASVEAATDTPEEPQSNGEPVSVEHEDAPLEEPPTQAAETHDVDDTSASHEEAPASEEAVVVDETAQDSPEEAPVEEAAEDLHTTTTIPAASDAVEETPEADEASAPVGEVPDALSRRFGDQAEVSDDFQEDELESTTIRRRAFVAPQEESPVTEAAWKPREDAAERSVPQDTPESLDDVLFEGASIVPEMPSRTGAHLFSFILGILALPITWYLVADAGARMTLPEGNPAATGVINWLAITELAIAFVAIIALFEVFKRSSLGAWIAGLCFLAAGIPWVFAPAFTSAHTVSLLHFLQNAGSFGSNLAHHLQASGYSGRLLILGIVLMGVASLSHSARRRGRAEEAMREQVERVNPTGAHYTARERRRAAKAAGLR
jgi:hypothetical protein